MASFFETEAYDILKKQKDLFLKKLNSEIFFKSSFFGSDMSFDWIDEIEEACPFIDNVIRRPKLILRQEQNKVTIEKAKKITVASIKDLTRHTNNISKFNKKNNEIMPSKILEIRNEETYNIYENRFLYTMINDLNRFLLKKEDMLNNFAINENRVLEYVADTSNNNEKIKIEVKLTSDKTPDGATSKKIAAEIKEAKSRVKRIRDYITSWQRSEMIKALEKEQVSFITLPVKKTNIILKNPNFQIAVRLWEFLLNYDLFNNSDSEDNLEIDNNSLKSFLDHSFLIDYFVLDSISPFKKEQKERLSRYAILMITEEVYRTISLLIDNGVEITDEELLSLVSKEIKKEKNNRLVGVNDVKNKFKNAMEEYIERTQNYL